MKKFLFILMMLLAGKALFCAEKNKDELLKRTVAILPFYNQNSVEKYNYLSDTIRDSLKAKLILANNFVLTSFSLIDEKIKKLNIPVSEAVKDANIKKIAYSVKADIAVTGKYIIIEDKIMVSIEAADIFTGQIVAGSQITGEIGLDIFRIVNQITSDISDKMNKKIKKVNRTYFTEMSDVLKKEYYRSIFTKQRVTGIALSAAGSCLFVAGAPLFIYSLANYSSIVKYNRDYGPLTDPGYKSYYDSYWTLIGLLSSGISLMSTGIILTAIGIPLVLYTSKDEKASFNIDVRGINALFAFNHKF